MGTPERMLSAKSSITLTSSPRDLPIVLLLFTVAHPSVAMVAHLLTIVAHLMVVTPPMVDVVATLLSAALVLVVVTEIILPPEVATDLHLPAQATADQPMVA